MEQVTLDSWDFKGHETRALTHGIHPYPARMPPQLPRELIKAYRSGVTLIGDPYCGSGTTLLESMRAGIPCYGTDINGLATIISKVKTTVIRPVVLREARALIPYLRVRLKGGEIEDDDNERIEFLFSRHARRQLATIVRQVIHFRSKTTRQVFDVMLVSLAYTARKVSFQRWKEFKLYRIPKERRPYYRPDTYRIFLTHLNSSLDQLTCLLAEFQESGYRAPNVSVQLRDARFFKPPRKLDMIITSPPYGDSRTTVAYEEFATPAMLWLSKLGISSLEPKTLRQDDVLSFSPTLKRYVERIEQLDPSRSKDIQRFYEDVYTSINRMYLSLASGGRLCLVVGGRTIRGIYIPMDRIVEEFGANLGFRHEAKHGRTISAKTQPMMNHVARMINREYVEVFKRV